MPSERTRLARELSRSKPRPAEQLAWRRAVVATVGVTTDGGWPGVDIDIAGGTVRVRYPTGLTLSVGDTVEVITQGGRYAIWGRLAT